MKSGDCVQHYRLIDKIGEGGMGVVWRAEDMRLHRQVALKFVPENKARDRETVERHLFEARAASALNHPNICSVYDIGEWQERRYIVLELLVGRSLCDLLRRGPMDPDLAIEQALQVTDALASAHGKGIIHRDIKPANLFVCDPESEFPRTKILDFGLAKLSLVPSGPEEETRTALELTEPGTIVGTLAYMSPEQALGKPLDHRTDIFSLGAVLYEMFAGRRAFEGDTAAAIYDAILHRHPVCADECGPAVPPEVVRILERALEKDPSLRYQSAADLGADLRRVRRDSSSRRLDRAVESAPPAAGGRSTRGWWWVAGAAVGVVVVAGLGLQRVSDSEGRARATAPATVDVDDEVAPDGPSIVVLPFRDANPDPGQSYFGEGLREDIVAELSRFPELTVLAGVLAAASRDDRVDGRATGAAPAARYLLEGSVRRSGDRIRVSVQLSDDRDGRSVWGDRYERQLTAQDLFELQDELTQQVVNAIAGSYGALARAELPQARTKPRASLASYDCILRTYDYLQVHVAEKHLAARECLEEVLAKEPEYAEGQAWLGYLYAEEYHHRWNARPDEYDSLERAFERAREAVSLDEASTVAHGALALTHYFRGEYADARVESYKTIELSPNNALWLTLLGTYLAQREEFEDGLRWVRRAKALDPHPPPWIEMAFFYWHYREARYEEALDAARQIELGEDFRESLFLAAPLGQLGRIEEARSVFEEFQRRWSRPLAELRQELIERNAFTPALVDHLLEGLTKAGLEVRLGGPSAAPRASRSP